MWGNYKSAVFPNIPGTQRGIKHSLTSAQIRFFINLIQSTPLADLVSVRWMDELLKSCFPDKLSELSREAEARSVHLTSAWLNPSQVRRETCQRSGNMMYSIYTIASGTVYVCVCVCVCIYVCMCVLFANGDCAAVRGSVDSKQAQRRGGCMGESCCCVNLCLPWSTSHSYTSCLLLEVFNTTTNRSWWVLLLRCVEEDLLPRCRSRIGAVERFESLCASQGRHDIYPQGHVRML